MNCLACDFFYNRTLVKPSVTLCFRILCFSNVVVSMNSTFSSQIVGSSSLCGCVTILHDWISKHSTLWFCSHRNQNWPLIHSSWHKLKHECFLSALLSHTLTRTLHLISSHLHPPLKPMWGEAERQTGSVGVKWSSASYPAKRPPLHRAAPLNPACLLIYITVCVHRSLRNVIH